MVFDEKPVLIFLVNLTVHWNGPPFHPWGSCPLTILMYSNQIFRTSMKKNGLYIAAMVHGGVFLLDLIEK